MNQNNYQNYVIKNGTFVGKFEEMYQNCTDPWEQSTRETFASEKATAINQLKALQPRLVIEFGCGFGNFTSRIRTETGLETIGVDISKTAIEKAAIRHPECKFITGDFSDFDFLMQLKPDAIVLSEVTWYILEKLPDFLLFIKNNLPNTYIIHLLNIYPTDQQKYGREYFFDLPSILKYFNMNYIESGEVEKYLHGNCKRTFFLGRYAKLDDNYAL